MIEYGSDVSLVSESLIKQVLIYHLVQHLCIKFR